MFLCQKFGVYKLVMLVRRYQLRAADACCTFPVLKVTDPSLLGVTATDLRSARTFNDLKKIVATKRTPKIGRKCFGVGLMKRSFGHRFKRRLLRFFLDVFFFGNGMIVPNETWYRMVGVFR